MTLDQLLDEADREMYAAKADHQMNRGRLDLASTVARKLGL
jgi:hypothetical protein